MGHPFDTLQRRRTTILIAIVSVSLGVPGGCGPSQTAKQTNANETDAKVTTKAKDIGVKRYNLTGKVVSIDKPAHSINIDGDEVPGFMAEMTMPYQVKDPKIIDKVAPGDQIKAEIVVGNDGAYLENISIVRKASPPALMK